MALDRPPPIATTRKVPEAPAGSVPEQPAGLFAARFQEMASSRGTPSENRTVGAAAGLQVAESQTTWPCLVTTTRTDPGPYVSSQGAVAVETAYTSNRGRAPGP